MRTVIVDLETYWDSTHTLSKMSPIAYCAHPNTEIISCAFKFDGAPTEVIFGEEQVIAFAKQVDWSDCFVAGHNLSGFDAMILSWRMGVKPRVWGCTLAMARPWHAKNVGLSLGALVQHYGIGVKNNAALLQTKGKRLKDFTDEEIDAMRVYNAADVDQCRALLARLIKKTSVDEMLLIDMTIRMLVDAQFDVDTALLEQTFADEAARKLEVLSEFCRVTGDSASALDAGAGEEAARALLSSAAKFAAFLRHAGVDVPTKISPLTVKPIPALAKTDAGFLALQEHPDPRVSIAASARLDAKSTLLQTRITSFLAAANAHPESKLPVPLKYYGADTTGRWSGWAYNPQNLPRINPNDAKPTDALRNCLRAPKGHSIIVADLSGIELRVNHFLWKVPSSMQLYQEDPAEADLYKDFAAKLYNLAYKDVTKPMRQVGKVAHLGLGFGAGATTFRLVAKLMGGVDLSAEEAEDVVRKWREAYPEITSGWKKCHGALPIIMRGGGGACVDPWGMITTTPEGLQTPRGKILYPNLRLEPQEGGRPEFVYGDGRHKARVYAGKIDENIVQHLARNVIADNALAIRRLYGLTPALMVHDELVYIVRQEDADALLGCVQSVMRTPPTWWPKLVVWSEGGVSDTYGGAK